jgi:hypothetical protein
MEIIRLSIQDTFFFVKTMRVSLEEVNLIDMRNLFKKFGVNSGVQFGI